MKSKEETLATLFIELDLSKRQFISLRKFMKESNALCIPSYQKILEAKEACVPRQL